MENNNDVENKIFLSVKEKGKTLLPEELEKIISDDLKANGYIDWQVGYAVERIKKMIKKENNPQKNFRIPPKKYGYGELTGVFLLLGGVFNMFSDKLSFKSLPHSLGIFLIFLTTTIAMALGLAFFYFLILWIMKLVRNLGKIERPENRKTKKILTIIFIILLLAEMISVGLSMSRAISSSKVSPQQTSFVNALLEKNKDWSNEIDGVKVSMQALLDVMSNKEFSKMHGALENLLSATKALQPKIEDMKVFYQQGASLSRNEKEQHIFDLSVKALGLRDQDNKKLIEMATFGLTIDWENPTEAQIAKWTQLAKELGVIETEIQNTQTELQNAF